MSEPEASVPAGSRIKRGRSKQYPRVPLQVSIELVQTMDQKGLDGLAKDDIAAALGYSNIKTNTFSGRLSAAGQFGLLTIQGNKEYHLTPLARAILHPVDPREVPALHRKALRKSGLYSTLIDRFEGKRLPEPALLANLLYRDFDITSNAKLLAAENFLESLRFAGALTADGVLLADRTGQADPSTHATVALDAHAGPRLTEVASSASRDALEPDLDDDHVDNLDEPDEPVAPHRERPTSRAPRPHRRPDPGPKASAGRPAPVRFDLHLWGADDGKVIQVRAPETVTPESFERLVSALRLHIRVEAPNPPRPSHDTGLVFDSDDPLNNPDDEG